MERRPFKVTEKAGKYVAGTNNPGVGQTIWLTEAQAELAVDRDELKPNVEAWNDWLKANGNADEVEEKAEEKEPAKKSGGKKEPEGKKDDGKKADETKEENDGKK